MYSAGREKAVSAEPDHRPPTTLTAVIAGTIRYHTPDLALWEPKVKTIHTLIIALLLLAALPCRADAPIATLTVAGQALLQVPPDQLTIDMGVTSVAETARQALEDNNSIMEAVMAALMPLGLDASAMQTRQFQVRPVWSQRPRQPAADWQSQITAYQVSNSVLITTPGLKLAGDIIGKATTAGANQVNAVSFGLADPRAHREEAIALATNNAASDAKTLAAAAGQTIVRVLELSLDHSEVSPVRLRQESQLRSAVAADLAPQIQAGEVPVRASVSIRYEIK